MPNEIFLKLGDFHAEGGGPKAGVDEAGGLKIEWDSSIQIEVFNPYQLNLLARVKPDQGPSDATIP